uniref:DUF305 domain-containing protein n=1 Tax=viral metagenome TaxID=1070528 RepID=A0A6C0HGK4_9ZZZZ
MIMHHSTTNHLHVMFVIMVLSGFLTTMNVWADSINDIRFSLNDLYMTLLMTGWMFIFMGLFYKQHKTFLIGILLAIVNFWCIRSQFMISQQQYILGMIPHHSMAVHMSKKVLENNDLNNNIKLKSFVENIISNQSKEIVELKNNV